MSPTAVLGAIGAPHDQVSSAFQSALSLAQDDQPHLQQVKAGESFQLWSTPGSAALRQRGTEEVIAWTQAGAPDQLSSDWRETARSQDASGLLSSPSGSIVLHGSVSGAQPLYVRRFAGAVFFSTRLRWLMAALPGRLTPDSAAWGQILAFGAPLAGRTTFAEAQRVQPMQFWEYSKHSGEIRSGQAPWPWEDVEPDAGRDLGEATEHALSLLSEQLRPHIQRHDEPLPVNPMLSGGRDSRLLAALAQRLSSDPERITAWTTSSDTGTAMEELVAARTARQLGIRQQIVAPRFDEFARDFGEYANLVDYQASYHVWLTPVARALTARPGTILDGLGGGVFLGGGFPDPQQARGAEKEQLLNLRFSRMSRYLEGADQVFTGETAASIREAGREDFRAVASRFTDHPNGHTLSAYLTRTLPGISLAPAAVLGGSQPVAMPIISDAVVSLALSIDPVDKADGAWYPRLLAAADQRLSGQPTAADLTAGRHHIRRGASREAISFYRDRLVDSPVAELLNPALREGPESLWARMLNNTKHQHLLRGLAMMSLWHERYEDQLSISSLQEVLNA